MFFFKKRATEELKMALDELTDMGCLTIDKIGKPTKALVFQVEEKKAMGGVRDIVCVVDENMNVSVFDSSKDLMRELDQE
ncbi:hypothetical protein FJZ41_00835 [Candidatus Shapirobacteria bacterium]|nr:hypothetical protein [Candidatus Shapirobacteria bacterium]